MFKRLFAGCVAIGLIAFAGHAAWPQTRTIRIVVPFPAGGSADIRGSVRVWDLAIRAITKTIVVGNPASPAGTMEVQLIPRDQPLR